MNLIKKLKQNTEANYIFVNERDYKITTGVYEIQFLMETITYIVCGYSEQNALDTLIDYFELQGWTGYYMTLEELEKNDISEDSCIVAGNHCYYIESHCVFIKKLEG